jgi:hypothetical protein
MTVKTSSAMAADESTRPGMSGGAAASGSLEAGMTRAASATASAATGAMAMKMLAQLKCSSSQPSAIGPIAMATTAIAPYMQGDRVTAVTVIGGRNRPCPRHDRAPGAATPTAGSGMTAVGALREPPQRARTR